MESVYPPKEFDCSGKLKNLKSHFEEFSKSYRLEKSDTFADLYFKLYGKKVSSDALDSLSKTCSIEKLKWDKGTEPIDPVSYMKQQIRLDGVVPEAAKRLRTVRTRINWDEKSNVIAPVAEELNLTQEFNSTKIDFQPGSEILITIRVYRPFNPIVEDLNEFLRHIRIKCSQEIIILGSQTLKELKNKILCDNTNAAIEVEDVFDYKPKEIVHNFNSSMICLDDKLYVDLCDKNPVDYSTVVKQWGKEKKLPEFQTKNMSEAIISDLGFRMGYPYVYQHCGDCEHVLEFSDARLAKRSDSLCRDDYPYCASLKRVLGKNCDTCRKALACWLCVDGDRLVHNPSSFCHQCLVRYNYVDGKKIGQFKVYRCYNPEDNGYFTR